MVMLYHGAPYSYGAFNLNWFQKHGFVGVDIFFAISGFLICSRLLEEETAVGRISLKDFYIRRAFRILPAAVCYLLVLIPLAAIGLIPLLPKEWFAALFFCRNYSFLSFTPGHVDWFTSHFWSLSLEEQFYLIFPWILAFAPKRYRIAALSALIACVILWRSYRQLTHPWDQMLKHLDTRLDALLIPALLAVLFSTERGKAVLTKISTYWPLFAIALFLWITYNPAPYFFLTVQSVLIPLILLGTILNGGNFFSKFLELRPLRWLGKLSYGIYLWQQLFFTGHYVSFLRPFGFVHDFPFPWIATLALATASYYLLEQPFISYGRKLLSEG